MVYNKFLGGTEKKRYLIKNKDDDKLYSTLILL